jgi:hypothetical protein
VLQSLTKWAILALTLVLLAVIGSGTFLAYKHVIAGSTVTEVFVLILTSLGVGAGAHIGSNAVTSHEVQVEQARRGPVLPVAVPPVDPTTVVPPLPATSG